MNTTYGHTPLTVTQKVGVLHLRKFGRPDFAYADASGRSLSTSQVDGNF